MSKHASATLIGGFIIGALILATLAVSLFGGQNIFRKKEQIIMYFSESVYGLDEGAPVNIRGVQVGTVKKINIIFNTESGDFRVPVLVEVNPGSIAKARELDIGNQVDPIKTLIENLGLRGRLQIQSILTSQLYIELDYHPETEINYYGDGSILEVPTIPSQIARFNKVLDKVSLDTVVEELTSSISAINKFVSSKEFSEAMTDLQAMLKSMQSASSNVGVLAQELREEATVFNDNSAATMAEITRLAKRMDDAFSSVNRVLGKDSPELEKVNNTLDEISRAAKVISELKDSPERYRLEKALEELQSAARSVRELTESIENNPQSLIWGKKQGSTEP
jgi:paraquat-inducible protein B